MLSNILLFIAGIGVLLFAISMLSSNLQKICGNNVRKKINQFSKNRFSAIGFGFGFTAIIQSSTASVIMIAGFTTAGIIGLFQALGLTIGANIASVIPSFLISFKTFSITDFFCAFAGIGAIMAIFVKKPLTKQIANAIISFGLLFIGMELMNLSVSIFETSPTFINFFSSITNPVLLILLGTAFTALIQSSLGTVAVVMTLVGTSSVVGIISIESAACIIYGANLGTAISTALLASLSSNTDGKRTVLFHIIYSFIGTIIFGLLTLTDWINVCLYWIAEPTIKLAVINLIFNVGMALILAPLIQPFMWLLKKIVRTPKRQRNNILEIEDVHGETSTIAIAKATEKTILFYHTIQESYNETVSYIKEAGDAKFKKLYNKLTLQYESLTKLNNYIIKIPSFDVAQPENDAVENLLLIMKQLDRNIRNCIKILNTLKDSEKKPVFSSKLLRYINKLTENTNQMFELAEKYILQPDCNFIKNEQGSSFYELAELKQANSDIKLDAKTFVIENGGVTKSTKEKNVIYTELINYLGLISNNLLDLVFSLRTKNFQLNKNFEQLTLLENPKDDSEN